MAVGTLTGMHCSAGTTYVDITFARPSNCTKIIFIMTATDGVSAPIQKSYTIPLPYAIGASITYRFTGLSSTKKYYLTGRPYNGSEAGTLRTYSNSTSSPVNCIVMPSAKTTATKPTTTTTIKSPTTSSSGSGPVTPGSSTGSTINGGTIASSSAAGDNTPTYSAGATDAPIPSDLNSPSRLSLKIPDLAPNQTYSIKIRAFTTDSTGQTVYSEYSTPIYLTTPGFSASGANHLTTNENGDILLKGGSIFAGDFGPDVGQFDVVTGETYGTGVILNQTGLAGLNAGTKQFYIDARTGNAYFAGTIAATIIQSAGYDGVSDGSAYSVNGTSFNLNNGSITAEKFRIDTDGNAYFKGDVAAATINGTALVSYIGSTAGTAAQDAANGVNKIYYSTGTGSSLATTVFNVTGPNGVTYTYTPGNLSATPPVSPATTLPNGPITSGSGIRSVVGDTYFIYDTNRIVIAQYTYASTGWVKVTVGGLTIANIDAGVITSGTIRAGISITSPLISGGQIYGATISTNASSSARRTVISSTSNSISFYAGGSADAGQFHLVPLNDSSNPGIIMHAGTSPVAITAVGGDVLTAQKPAMLLYKGAGGFGVFNLMVDNAKSFSILGVAQLQGLTTSDPYGFAPQLRNIRSVSTTNFSSVDQYGEDGEIMIVYSG